MGRQRSAHKPRANLLAAGIAALLVAAALFCAPWLLPDAGAAGLLMVRVASGCAAAVGIALVAVRWIGRRGDGDAPPSKRDPAWSSQLPADLLRRHPRGFDHTETPPITRSMEPGRPPRARPARTRQQGVKQVR